jgi:hypothetical protein
MAIASSTSSLFLPATRPFNDSSASLSFFNRTCFSNEAASLSLACNPKMKSLSFDSYITRSLQKLIIPKSESLRNGEKQPLK